MKTLAMLKKAEIESKYGAKATKNSVLFIFYKLKYILVQKVAMNECHKLNFLELLMYTNS